MSKGAYVKVHILETIIHGNISKSQLQLTRIEGCKVFPPKGILIPPLTLQKRKIGDKYFSIFLRIH